jgi:hypothetical protein
MTAVLPTYLVVNRFNKRRLLFKVIPCKVQVGAFRSRVKLFKEDTWTL